MRGRAAAQRFACCAVVAVVAGGASPPATQVEIGPAQAGSEVHLHPAQKLSVALPAASAAGEQCWVADSPVLELLRLQQAPARPAGTHAWVFLAVRAGRGVLRFECRPALSKAPSRRLDFRVRVDAP